MIGALDPWSQARTAPPLARRLGLACLALLAFAALLGPLLWPVDPLAQNLRAFLQPPSMAHPLGTDHLGRDVLARVLSGAAHSLGLAALSVALAASIGIALGLVAAARGGWTDTLIMRLADLVLAMPGLLLALLLAGLMGGGIVPLLLGINLTLWPPFARMTRAVALTNLQAAHVEAARLAGFGEVVIARRHVLPPVLRQISVLAALGVGNAILTIAALGFLGLGLRPPTPEWGAMVAELLPHAAATPVALLAPCALIFLAVLGATLLVDDAARRSLRSARG